jgi:hypothetical protein
MLKGEVFKILIKVVTSWQVIVVTVALIIYISLVSYVARLYHKPGFSFAPKKAKKQKPAEAVAAATQAAPAEGSGGDDELGLEQE